MEFKKESEGTKEERIYINSGELWLSILAEEILIFNYLYAHPSKGDIPLLIVDPNYVSTLETEKIYKERLKFIHLIKEKL